jgi:transposase
MKVRHTTSAKRHSSVFPSDILTLRKELRAERTARIAAEATVARQREQIESLEAQLARYRSGRRETEEMLQNEIQKLRRELAERDDVIENVKAQLVWFRENYMKTSRSEVKGADGQEHEDVKSHEAQDQSDTEATDSSGTDENDNASEQPKRPRGQQRGAKGPSRSNRSGIRSDTDFLDIPGCACKSCGKAFRRLDVTKPSPLIELYKELVRIMYHRYVYVQDCDCSGNKQIVTADPPPKLFDRTELGNTVWTHFLTEKHLFGTPTNRTLKELNLMGLSLSAGTVTGGFCVINDKLDLLYRGIIDRCRGADLWNADETWWRVFGKRWWMWLVASDDAVVYLLDPSRSKKVPNYFFGGSVGVLMTDRLASYKALHEGIRKVWCWVHQRRDFLNVFKSMPKLKEWAKQWLKEIARLFVLNLFRFRLFEQNKTRGMEWQKANDDLKQHVEHLKALWESELKQTDLHKKQRTILESMQRHWDGLTLFLSDPRIPLENNRAERLLRNPVVLRKNSYRSGSEWSGELAAKVFSIFQTWLINDLNPEALLLDYLNECSKPGRPPPDISLFLPWTMSEERKRQFQLPKTYQRPG